MAPDGSDTTRVLDFSKETGTEITGFVVAEGEIYFDCWSNGTTLKSFNIETEEIKDFNITDASLLTLSPDKKALQFSHEMSTITHISFKNGEISIAKPSNFDRFFEKGHIYGILYSTTSDGKIVFTSSTVSESGIFVMDKSGHTEEIYSNEGYIEYYINADNEWIYFTLIPTNSYFLDLYRIKNDGTGLELVYEKIASAEKGLPSVFINLFSEDLIFFKVQPRNNEIYVL